MSTDSPHPTVAETHESLLARFHERTLTEAEAETLLAIWDENPLLLQEAGMLHSADGILCHIAAERILLSPQRLDALKSAVYRHFDIREPDPAVPASPFAFDYFPSTTLTQTAAGITESTSRALIKRETGLAPQDPTSRRHDGRNLPATRPLLLILLLALILVPSAIVLEFYWSAARQDHGRMTTFIPVARLTASAFARWDDGKTFFPVGEPFDAEVLRLTEGLASLRLHGGASLIARGPVAFSVDREGSVHCTAGSLSFDVPPQKKPLRVKLPQMTVVVHGTRFSVQATELGSEVHLFEGRVDVELGQGIETVHIGQSLLVTHTGEVRRLDANPASFVTPETMKSKAAESEVVELAQRRERWETLQNDPAFLWGDDFETPGAAWKSCSTASGRIAGTSAVSFRDAESVVPIDVPTELTSMTLAAWVHVDRLGSCPNILLTTKTYSTGSVKWQFDRDGTVRLFLPNHRSTMPFGGPRALNSSRLGIWTHLAVTVDGDSRAVRHYLNGKEIHCEIRDAITPFRIGAAMIGNADPSHYGRRGEDWHFHGAIDELLIFNRCLEPGEILDIIR